jgi:hypothetical protein
MKITKSCAWFSSTMQKTALVVVLLGLVPFVSAIDNGLGRTPP